MDLEALLTSHRSSGAALTVAVLPVDRSAAEGFGLMRTNASGRIQEFREKPRGQALDAMRVDTGALGLSSREAERRPYLASMGIYVFERKILFDLLDSHPNATDFGQEIIPAALDSGQPLQSYLFDTYWEDIGTIKAFYDANLAWRMNVLASAFMMRKLRFILGRAFCLPVKFMIQACAVR